MNKDSASAQTGAAKAEQQRNPHVRARFAYVATQQRASVRVTGSDRVIESWPDGSKSISEVIVHLDCGHSYSGSLHHTHPVGDRALCLRCGEIAAMKLPEFAGYTPAELGVSVMNNALNEHAQAEARYEYIRARYLSDDMEAPFLPDGATYASTPEEFDAAIDAAIAAGGAA